MPQYNKLVRDRIPEIIRASGRACETITLSEPEYFQALRDKLVEEAREAAAAAPAELPDEIADLYEVIDALIAAARLSRTDILGRQAAKRAERGAFTHRICLLSTD